MLRLEGRNCVIVGGGRIATRKVKGLIQANARVTIISPQLTAELEALADEGRIAAQIKPYSHGDLARLLPLLVFAATDDAAVNRAVADEARSIGALVNTVDNAEGGDFQNMATARRGSITVTVGTGGISPALAKNLAARLAAHITDDDVRAASTRSQS